MYFNPSSSPFLIGKDVRGELRAAETKAEVERLRIDVERLFMISEALWRLLKEKHGYSDEQFEDLVQEVRGRRALGKAVEPLDQLLVT